jgi:hypothetical protein
MAMGELPGGFPGLWTKRVPLYGWEMLLTFNLGGRRCPFVIGAYALAVLSEAMIVQSLLNQDYAPENVAVIPGM